MKKSIFILLILIGTMLTGFCQKRTTVSQETRMNSVVFANGLKDFYSGNYTTAEEKFVNVITKDESNAVAYYMLGRLKKETMSYPEAEFYLRKAIQYDKKNVWYIAELAEVLSQQGHYAEAEKMWAKACAMDNDNEDYLLAYAETCMKQGKIAATISVFDKIEKVVGVTPEITGAKVELHLYENDVNGAVAEYAKLIKENPNDEDSYIQAANILISNNMTEKALPYLTKAAALNPENGEVQLALGDYYASRKDDASAFTAYLAAIRCRTLDAEKKNPVLVRYMAPLKTGNVTEQQIALAKAMKETHPDVMEGWALCGTIAICQKNYAEAATYLEQALKLNASEFALWQDYLHCLMELKQYDKVVAHEQELTELFPISYLIYYTLGVAYCNLDKPQEALQNLQQAQKYTYDKKELKAIYATMAEVYSMLGQSDNERIYREKAH